MAGIVCEINRLMSDVVRPGSRRKGEKIRRIRELGLYLLENGDFLPVFSEAFHHLNVFHLVYRVASRLGRRSFPDPVDAALSCILHDIGKLLVPEVRFPRVLSAEEREKVKRHVRLGYEVLRKAGADDLTCLVSLLHHEDERGGGYLGYRLKDEFMLAVRICDMYSAMREERSYREGYTHEAALKLIENGEGRDGVVKEVISVLGELERSGCSR